VLTPVPAEVSLSYSAELRPLHGGVPIWQLDQNEVIPTNVRRPTTVGLEIPAPLAEGTYVLEVRSSWQPIAGRDETWLRRWLKRRRGVSAMTTSTRRVALAVVGPGPLPAPPATGADATVDSIDPGRPRSHRLWASGRSPGGPGQRPWSVPEAALALVPAHRG